MPMIRCPDGELRDYAEYNDFIKTHWKNKMGSYMKKRNTCIICGAKATCFLYEDDAYIPYCIEHYKQDPKRQETAGTHMDEVIK